MLHETHAYEYMKAFKLMLALRYQHRDPETNTTDSQKWAEEHHLLIAHLGLPSKASTLYEVRSWMSGGQRFPAKHWEGLVTFCIERLGEPLTRRVLVEGWPLDDRRQ